MAMLTTVKNDSLLTAKQQLDTAKTAYDEAGTTFVAALKAAIDPMQGDTRDAIDEFIKDTLEPFIIQSVPSAVEGCSSLLEGNKIGRAHV